MNSNQRRLTRSILSAFLCFTLWLNALPLWAAEVHGQIKFGGLPVPGATVTASQGDRNFTAVADQMGNYSLPDLADGAWAFKIEMLGFAPVNQSVTVAAGAPASDFDLKMLSLDEIKAIAGPQATQAPTISYVPPADEKPTNTAVPTPPPGKKPSKSAAAAAPANGQNSFQRTDLKANAAPPPANAAPPAENAANSSFNAQDTAELNQRASDGFLVNGSQNNGAASPFAQAGRFGNNIRGPNSLYQFMAGFIIDNSALDARTYSLTGQNTVKPQTNHFTVLGSFAGPLRIKHWFKQPPTIFLNYQFTRNTTGQTTSTLMPTADQIAGNFSASPSLIYDPTSGLPFVNNSIPASQISDQAKYLLSNFYKQPNFATGVSYNYQVPIVSLNQTNAMQARFNKSLTNKDQLSGQFGYQYQSNSTPNIFDFTDTGNGQGINVQLTEQHRFTPRMFGTLTVQFSRQSNQVIPFFANKQNVSGDAKIEGNNQEPINYGPPNLSFTTGIAGLSDQNSAFNRNQTTAISDNTTWIHGRHNVQYGGDFRWQQFNSLSQANPRGGFVFTGQATQNIVGVVNNVAIRDPNTGNAFADFLLGVPDTSSLSFGNADKYFRSKMVDAFLNDDWRVGPSLTLNLGVRWDYGSPVTEKYDRLVNLDVAQGFTAIAPVQANANLNGSLTGQKYPDSLVRPDWKEFQPILGFAWRPIPASSIVVRGGYSLRYNTSVYQQMATLMAQQSPLSTSLQVQNVFTNPPLNTLADGFNGRPGLTNNFAVDPNFRVGYAQNWNASIQKDLPASLIMILSYLGTKGTRGAQEFYPNTYPVNVTNPCASCPSGYIYETSNGNSTREAGNLQLRRRLHNGFTANLQYTYAKAIDDSNVGGRGASSLVAQNWLDLSGERGLSSSDQRHLVNFTMQYTTGQGLGGGALLSGWRGALFKEWSIVSSVNVGTGLPLTPIYAVTVPGTGFNGIRPNYTGADVYSNAPGQFLNPLAYTAPSGTWGNAGRDSITGPSQFSMNASFARTFRVHDKYTLDVRIDSVNPINHVTFTSWNTTINSPQQYGTAVSANAMRSLQTTLRLRF
jgi:trimeric autotransporter adhesin